MQNFSTMYWPKKNMAGSGSMAINMLLNTVNDCYWNSSLKNPAIHSGSCVLTGQKLFTASYWKVSNFIPNPVYEPHRPTFRNSYTSAIKKICSSGKDRWQIQYQYTYCLPGC